MYSVQQFGAGQQFRPQQYQYGSVAGYYPQQTTTGTDWTGMMSAIMPMIMMMMMMGMMIPMMKGMTAQAK